MKVGSVDLTVRSLWSADKKVATDTFTTTVKTTYTAPTQAQIDAAKKIADALPTVNNSSSTPAVIPKYTVVSGLQFVQVSTLSPTVIGSDELKTAPTAFAAKAALDAQAAAANSATALFASGVVAAVAALAF